ncbi:MAG: hypothetical protein AAF399_02505 [Bacteroidota bacterium]
MAKDQATLPAQDDPGSQLGAIQNIILGPAMAELNHRMAEVQANIATLNTGVDDRFQALAEKDLSAIQADIKALDERLQQFQQMAEATMVKLEEEKTSRARLGQLLVEMGQDLMK